MKATWTAIEVTGERPQGRSSHSLDVVGQSVFLMGGEHVARVPIGSQVWWLDVAPAAWAKVSTSGVEVPARNAHASAVVGNSIYIWGGRQGVTMGEGPLSDMYRLDTTTNTWSQVEQLGPIPEARSYHQMVAIGATLYVFGGCAASGRQNDLHAFHTETRTWREMPTSKDIAGRGGAGFAAVGDKLYVIGGFAGKEVGDVHQFDTAKESWTQIESDSPLPPRSVFGVAALGTRLVVMAGEVDPSSQGHEGAGNHSDHVYCLDTTRLNQGWTRAETKVSPPGATFTPRAWFPAAAYGDTSAVLFGGNALDNSRLDDAFLLQMDE